MRSRSGFTLIELMVVIAILGIGAAMSVSSLITILPKWRLENSANDVVTQLQFARFEAIRRNRPVIVRFSNIGNISTSSLAIYEDTDRNSAVSGGEPLIRSITIPSKYAQAYIRSVADGAGAATQIVFGSDGMLKGGTMPVTITLDSEVTTSPTQYQAIVVRSGLAKTQSVP